VVVAPAPGDPLGETVRELVGRARVERGLVHPYYEAVGRALTDAWHAERAVARPGVVDSLSRTGGNLRTYLGVWQQVAEGYGGRGALGLIDGGSDRMKELSGLPPGPATDALVQRELRRQLRPAFSRGHVTLVRVEQGADGRLRSIRVVSSSSDPEIDRAAVEDVRAVAEALPAPPDEARRGRDTLVSDWELELEISVTPPIPIIELEFDEVLGGKDLRVPLDRRVWKRVRLVAVY
jgi:TonB family protein